jgi:hypothetical protein
VAGVDEVVVEDLEVVVDVFEGAVAEAAGGFLAAAVVAAVVLLVLGLLGELGAPLTAVEVRRAAPVAPEIDVRFFSSSETEGRERCETVEAAVDGRLAAVVAAAVVPAAGRAGALLTPPGALVRVVELVVELVADFVEAAPVAAGRRVAAVAGAAVRLAVVPAVVFFSAAPFGEAGVAATAGSGAGAGAGASECWTTSKPSASDMVGNGDNLAESKGEDRRKIEHQQDYAYNAES